MPLSVKQRPYKIPEYSLTGDMLAYLTCGLQYRYYNRGSLPPSTPVQLWFGEFIHGVMEEAYLEWQHNVQRKRFPWNWDSEIRDIELQINRRLRAKGLNAQPWLFCPYDSSFTQQGWCPDLNHPHKLVASQRSEEAINTWGPHLFPLIEEAEVRLKGIQNMPNYQEGISRCNYYGITGVVDVISNVNLQNALSGNLILHYIHQNSGIQQIINILDPPEYEIIIDYKGMRRPSINDLTWKYHDWQILTYAWLRRQQPQSKNVIAGIIFYFNELALSQEDMRTLQNDVRDNRTDIIPLGIDLDRIQNWKRNTPLPLLSRPFKEQRSIRMMLINQDRIQHSLQEFNNVVGHIESCVLSEMGGEGIINAWNPNPNERNCTACDFKTFCPNPLPRLYRVTVP